MASSAAKRRLSIFTASSDDAGVVTRFTHSLSESPIVDTTKRAAGDAEFLSKKLLKSTGKAVWIAGTTFLILVVPLIIEMDREQQQFKELEIQQQSLLGPPPPPQVQLPK